MTVFSTPERLQSRITEHSVRIDGTAFPVYASGSTGAFAEYLARAQGTLAVDTETTGLKIFAPDFRLRLLIAGTPTEAFVLQLDGAPEWVYAEAGNHLRYAARRRPIAFHNATYDRLVLDRAGVFALEDLDPEEWHDTRTMAHLLDPRARQEGGTGHALKDLADLWIDRNASAEGQKVLREVFKANGWTKETGWREIPLDHPDYVRYAGLDAILTARLYDILEPHLRDRDLGNLYLFERHVADLCARMERGGILVDADYVADALLPWLEEMESEGVAEARSWGVENVNSTAQVAEALQGLGWTPEEFTATGKPRVDKAVLNTLSEAGNPVAQAVQKAKRGGKWLASYALPMLEERDENGRIHPRINALQARTARMSVSGIPLQQLPSGDWRIRRALVADPGRVLWAADYDQVEMRVLAAMANETAMKEAIASGVDFHDFTAATVFGPDFTKAHRKLAKGVGFGKVYGGGAATISRQTGAPIEDVKRAIALYDRSFPGVRRFQKRLEDRASVGRREVVTASGRPLPLDGDRLYAATNYVVQSTSRDVLAQALLALDEAGLVMGQDILLPIHDEILGQCAPETFEAVADIVGREMTMDFLGVRLTAAAELYGPSWGHGYGATS